MNDYDLTDAELVKLKKAKTDKEWDSICAEIKAKRNGEYPDDWEDLMMGYGLMSDFLPQDY
jgi:hypothetical protein